jgi:hypothetical protein
VQFYGGQFFIDQFFGQPYFGVGLQGGSVGFLPPSALYFQGDYSPPWYFQSDYWDVNQYNPLVLGPTYSGQYFEGSFDPPWYFQSDYWSVNNYQAQPPYFRIINYFPVSGSTVGLGTHLYVTFGNTIQSGSLLFTLTESGGIPISGTTFYNGSTYTDTFVPNAILPSSQFFTATISGIDSKGSFTFSWPFYTNNGANAINIYDISLILPDKLLQPTYSYNLKIANLKYLKIRN